MEKRVAALQARWDHLEARRRELEERWGKFAALSLSDGGVAHAERRQVLAELRAVTAEWEALKRSLKAAETAER
jgi:hypothetical protein